MISTKGLYATTLVLAGAAGFSSGWAVKPADRVVLTEEERALLDYERTYDLTAADREALRAAIREYKRDIEALRDEVARQYQPQINEIQDRHDAVVARICTDAKRRNPAGR